MDFLRVWAGSDNTAMVVGEGYSFGGTTKVIRFVKKEGIPALGLPEEEAKKLIPAFTICERTLAIEEGEEIVRKPGDLTVKVYRLQGCLDMDKSLAW